VERREGERDLASGTGEDSQRETKEEGSGHRRVPNSGAETLARGTGEGGKGRGSGNPATQRAFLLGVTRAYRTTSNVALEVLAGCVPPHIEAAARHENWRARGTAKFEGKAVFAEGPHPEEPERKWEELPAETIPGTSFWTDASQGEGGTPIGIVITEEGETKEARGLRLQDGYLMHMAELYALRVVIKSVTGQRGKNFNFVTDSRVALDMLTKRKGGAAHAILKEMERIETEGSTVKLWWSSHRNRGIAEADRTAKKARKIPEEFPEDQASITGRMIKKKATKVAMAKWQQEWDQGDKGRATHEIIGTVDRRLRGWSHRAVCLLTVWHRTPLIFGVRFVGMGSLTVVPVENRRVERCGRISSEWVAGVIPKAYIMDKHLENQARPAQIPVHLNVLLRSQQFQVPPPSPPSPTQQPGHPQTPTHPLPRRHLFQKLHPQPGRQRNRTQIKILLKFLKL
jgi:hypothetical protein